MAEKQEHRFTIEELALAIANFVRPPVPIEYAQWDCADIASYMRKSPSVVRERIACLPDFPKPFRARSLREGRIAIGHPTWKAIEVIHWYEAHRDQTKGRPRKTS